MPKKRTPQEKKALSLQRDRRNVYGESTKGTRVGIPRSKRQSKQAERRAANQPLLAVTSQPDDESAYEAEEDSEMTALDRVVHCRVGKDNVSLGFVPCLSRTPM
jgi:hypothetical protein